ncbi:MAG: serpin family protein [Saccharofermentans sp.]|nr:serpin family protein [Saccharofermentans sp.]
MKNSTKRFATAIMTALMATSMMTGCDKDTKRKNKKDSEETTVSANMQELPEIKRNPVKASNEVDNYRLAGYTNFSIELLKNSYEGNNTMVSPLSVMAALGMTMNGADAETLAQMEEMMGMSLDEVNELMYIYNEMYCGEEIKQANSIFLNSKNNYTIQQDFRQSIVDYYNSDIQVGLFDDSMVKYINEFVDTNTNHRIDSIINKLDPDRDEMVLVNALTFDAKWGSPFEGDAIHDREFTMENGETFTVSMMFDEIYGGYLCGDNEEGFIKRYEDGNYAFVALLPEEGMTMADYLATLDADEINAMLLQGGDGDVCLGLPAFETNYENTLVPALKNMGMVDAFGRDANFTKMLTKADGEDAELYVSDVIHKTYIKVDSEGTEAAAATAVVMVDKATAVEVDTHFVTLDRPFVYMIVDCNTNMPVFIGAYNGLEQM